MIATKDVLDKETMSQLQRNDPVVRNIAPFFELLEWGQVPEQDETKA